MTARAAYRRLLEALQGEYDEGGFPGAGTPQELAGADLGEAKHRYLRAIWETEPVESRAAAVVTAVEEVVAIGGGTRLAALEATRREPLADLDAVLPDLIARLQAVPIGYGFGAQARRLLAEATERHGGVDGLAELARTPGDRQADAYRDWTDALARAGRLDDAEEAATEALDRLEPHGRTVAAIAERLTTLAAAREDGTAVLAARRLAWQADPTLTRLLDLVGVATALGARAEIIAAQADRHPAPVVVAFLLAGASDAIHHERWEQSLLLELLDRANRLGGHYDHPGADDGLESFRAAVSVGAGTAPGERDRAVPRDQLLLSALLTEVLDRTPPERSERERWLRTARHHIDARIHTVVAGQHRGAYAEVAHLAASCAEAVMLAADPTTARQYLDLHARCPRHSSSGACSATSLPIRHCCATEAPAVASASWVDSRCAGDVRGR